MMKEEKPKEPQNSDRRPVAVEATDVDRKRTVDQFTASTRDETACV